MSDAITHDEARQRLFPIPMRGNETTTNGASRSLSEVPDPHEG